jgi:hypothetical protein
MRRKFIVGNVRFNMSFLDKLGLGHKANPPKVDISSGKAEKTTLDDSKLKEKPTRWEEHGKEHSVRPDIDEIQKEKGDEQKDAKAKDDKVDDLWYIP